MLRIYYADALTDKEKFIFDHVDPRAKTILLVPDQFSLQAEKDALRYCGLRSEGAGEGAGGSALLELMVTDFSALGHKVVKETEGHEPEIIDKYGRHMLLSVLLERIGEELTVFRGRRGIRGTSALAEEMNQLISEMKRYEITPQRLADTIEELRGEASGSYLTLKLQDVLKVYRAYEEAIEGVYQDAEDYITYYADRIPQSEIVHGSEVWVYGFDTFTPKNLLVIRRLLETARNVSVVLTYEDADAFPADRAPLEMLRSLTQSGANLFRLTEQIMKKLEETAAEAGVEHRRLRIEGYPRRSMWNAGAIGGARACAAPGAKSAADAAAAPATQGSPLQDRIHLVQAAGAYEEAESAAAFIQSLVRDQGYRYGEIAVLCNDMDRRGRQLQRAFERWDIPAFADQKRKVLHQPVVSFLLSFLEVLTDGLRGAGLMGLVKSGLLGWSIEDEGLLENYIREFRIQGKRWEHEFVWDGEVYTPEELARLNEMRVFLVEVCRQAKDAIGRRNTAEEKVRGLVSFLQENFGILERIQLAVERQQELRLLEGAAETAQIWNAICGIFDQIIQVIGPQRISNTLLCDMITAGLGMLEIGLVPVSDDCVLMGTLQRSRPGQIRALVVTGANAGLLPLDIPEEGLLSRREKERLEAMDLEFAGREKIARMEEQLAICRMFSLPSEHLYVSCSQMGEDGSMLRPSDVFQTLLQWQPVVLPGLSAREAADRIGSCGAAVPYLAEALREMNAEENNSAPANASDELWLQVLDWYWRNDPGQARRLMRGIRYDNHMEALGEEMADALYRGDRDALNVSASRLEKYSGCAFAHFIQYGLRAQEQRLYEVGGREIGDVYHQCMMEFSRTLEAATLEQGSGLAAHAAPTWQTITEEECRARIARILQENTKDYREGLFSSDGQSEFRMERITEICGDIAWTMVGQVRQGRIKKMYFEEPFGKFNHSPESLEIPAVEVRVGDKKIRIRGVIDRLDVIDTGEGQPDGIRIVDYKTGNNTIRVEDFETGYKLQLMVYMDAALRASGDSFGSEPAGVFYFKIRDLVIDGDQSAGIPDPEDPGDLEQRMNKFYRMEGIVINDPALISAMDTRLDGSAKAESSVIPAKYDPKKGCFVKASGGTLLEPDEFQKLMEETNRQVERICKEICRGEIAAIPKRESKTDRDGNRISACKYCGFRSICGFDPSIRGCRYEDVR